MRPCCKAADCTRGLARKREIPLACPQLPAACGIASLGRSANVSKMEAKRAERRLSGKTVPAATRAAQSVCVCIEPPSLGIKACCQRLLSYYLLSAICLVGRSHQLTEVMGSGQTSGSLAMAAAHPMEENQWACDVVEDKPDMESRPLTAPPVLWLACFPQGAPVETSPARRGAHRPRPRG